MSLLERLIAGSHHRKTRFHDQKGNLVSRTALLNAPAAFLSAALKRLFGVRPVTLMISYQARARLERLIRPDWRILEFGSGRSTIWFSRRCAFIHSREDLAEWRDLVAAILRREGRENHSLEFRPGESYADLSDWQDLSFDLVMIDGTDRDGCVRESLAKVKQGGWIYLDNTDKDVDREGGDLRRAENRMLKFLDENPQSEFWYFTDFSPTNFFAEQGLLVKVVRRATSQGDSPR